MARLALWGALRVAIRENWGSSGATAKQTQLQFASEIVDAFDGQDPIPDAVDVEELLMQVMEEEFDTLLEDDSAQSVATDILRLWEEVSRGKEDLVLEYEGRAEKIKGKDVQALRGVPDDPEQDWSDGDEDPEDEDGVPTLIDTQPQPQPPERPPREEPEVDEDGFTTVKKTGRR